MQPLDLLKQFLWCLTGNKPLQYILIQCVCDGFGRGTDLSRRTNCFHRTCFVDFSVSEIDARVNSIDLDLENKAKIPLYRVCFFQQG